MALEIVILRVLLQQPTPTKVRFRIKLHTREGSLYSSYPFANVIFTVRIHGESAPSDNVFSSGEPTGVFSDSGYDSPLCNQIKIPT